MGLNRAGIFLSMLILLTACYSNTDKSQVEKQNDERFSNRNERDDKKDAQFLVDAVDNSYGILEVAQLGEEKITSERERGLVKQILEGQTTVSIRLKTLAEANDISIPFSGPERTKTSVVKLRDRQGDEFAESWINELKDLHQQLKKNISSYRKNADSTFRNTLDSTLVRLEENEHLIFQVEESLLNNKKK